MSPQWRFEAARYARDRLGVPVRCGMFEETGLAAPAQAVCAFHVLETCRI